MLHATVKSHRASYRSLAEGIGYLQFCLLSVSGLQRIPPDTHRCLVESM